MAGASSRFKSMPLAGVFTLGNGCFGSGCKFVEISFDATRVRRFKVDDVDVRADNKIGLTAKCTLVRGRSAIAGIPAFLGEGAPGTTSGEVVQYTATVASATFSELCVWNWEVPAPEPGKECVQFASTTALMAVGGCDSETGLVMLPVGGPTAESIGRATWRAGLERCASVRSDWAATMGKGRDLERDSSTAVPGGRAAGKSGREATMFLRFAPPLDTMIAPPRRSGGGAISNGKPLMLAKVVGAHCEAPTK
jgi:hypothetical protein